MPGSRVCVATVCFPTPSSVSEQYVRGLQEQTRDFRQVLVAEHGTAIADFLRPDLDSIAIQAPAGVTGVALRQVLLDRLRGETAFDIVVFADCDDRLLPNALDIYASALEDAVIAVGDMRIMDAEGGDLGVRFFERADIPTVVDGAQALDRRNWFGMTNTALHRGILESQRLSIPAEVRAVDWWLYRTLLDRGSRARSTATPTTWYRSSASGTLGYGPAQTIEALRRRLEIVRRHQIAISGRPSDEIERLTSRAHSDAAASALSDEMAQLPKTGVWYDDVFDLAGRS